MSRAAPFIAASRSGPKPWTIQQSGVSSSGDGKLKSLRRMIWNSTSSEASIAVPLISPSPWLTCGIADGKQPALHLHGVVHARACPDAPVVDIAAMATGRNRAHGLVHRRRHAGGAQMRASRNADAGQGGRTVALRAMRDAPRRDVLAFDVIGIERARRVGAADRCDRW